MEMTRLASTTSRSSPHCNSERPWGRRVTTSDFIHGPRVSRIGLKVLLGVGVRTLVDRTILTSCQVERGVVAREYLNIIQKQYVNNTFGIAQLLQHHQTRRLQTLGCKVHSNTLPSGRGRDEHFALVLALVDPGYGPDRLGVRIFQ